MPSRSFPLGLPNAAIPADTRIVGLWAIRKNSVGNAAYPVAVCCDPAQPVVKILLPNSADQWRPLPEGLLALTRLKGNQALLDEKDTLNSIDALLDQLAGLPGSTLLSATFRTCGSGGRTWPTPGCNPTTSPGRPTPPIPSAATQDYATSGSAPASAEKPRSTTPWTATTSAYRRDCGARQLAP